MKWKKLGRIVYANGESTTTYGSIPEGYRINSRKKAIPHANGIGFWMHTTYFLSNFDGKPGPMWEKEFYSLKDAKEAAEKMEAEVLR